MRHMAERAVGTWCALTPEEHRALCLIVGLFLLGLAVWSWRTYRPADNAGLPADKPAAVRINEPDQIPTE